MKPSAFARFVLGASVGIFLHFAAIMSTVGRNPASSQVLMALWFGGFAALMFGGWYMAKRRGYSGPLGLALAWFSFIGMIILALLPTRSMESDTDSDDEPAAKADPVLIKAIGDGDFDGVVKRLESGEVESINGRNRAGRTALHVALDEGHSKIAEFLLDKGASATARDRLGNTPLHLAAELGSGRLVERLIGMGADIHARGNDGWTPLHCAAAWDARSVVHVLVEQGADLDARNDKGNTPREQAEFESHHEMANILMDLEKQKAGK